jgi:hypothetical protein
MKLCKTVHSLPEDHDQEHRTARFCNSIIHLTTALSMKRQILVDAAHDSFLKNLFQHSFQLIKKGTPLFPLFL